ncbi:hypothetical protein RhiTH_005934 [Rhizoctonia solani]
MSKSTELLKSKKMIIVGGSSGLGRSLAAAVLAHGASVVIASSSQEKVNAALEKLKQEVPPAPNATITGQAVDLKDFTALKEFLSNEGPFDHFVITAGDLPGNFNFPDQEIDPAITKSYFDCPGLVDTEFHDSMPTDAKEQFFKLQREKLPVGHVGTPEEVAEAYIFAMKCTYLTGQVIVVDGGGVLV